MSEFVIEGTVNAKPETVFDVYLDHRRYAQLIKPIRSVELEREGEPPPNGLGAIRSLHFPGATVRELVTEYEPPTRYSYRMLSGLPVDFDASVTFTPTEEGTAVAYRVSVTASHQALPVQWPTKEAIRLFMRKAAGEAERIDSAARTSG